MKTLVRILYVIPIIGAVVGVVMMLLAPQYRMEKAVLAIAATVIPFCVAYAVKELAGYNSCNCNCACCNGNNKTMEAPINK